MRGIQKKILVMLTLLLVSCFGEFGIEGEVSSSVQEESCTGCSITIQSDMPLVKYSFNNSSPASTTLGGFSITTAGTATQGGVAPPTIGSPIVNGIGTLTSTGLTLDTVSMATAHDSTSAFVATITSTLTGDLNPSQSCSFQAPYQALLCVNISGFSISDTSLVSGTAIGINTFKAVSINSNTLPISAGTIRQISDLRPGDSDGAQNLAVMNDQVYFVGTSFNTSTQKLFRYDGTNVTQVSNTKGFTGQSDAPTYLTTVGNRLYFAATPSGTSNTSFKKLFYVEGSNVYEVEETRSGYYDDYPRNMVAYGSNLMYTARNTNGEIKLFMTAAEQSVQVSNTVSNESNDDYPTEGIEFNGSYYFPSRNTSNRLKLFRTNTSGILTNQLPDTSGSAAAADNPANFCVHNSELYFASDNASGASKLYKTDGSTVTELSNTRAATASDDNPRDLTSFNGNLYFESNNSGGFSKLYRFDGTNIELVADTSENVNANDYPETLTVYNNELYFIAANSNGARKLFKTDGTNVTQVSNTTGSQLTGDAVYGLTVFAGELYFKADNTNLAGKIFKTDGTNIIQVSNIRGDNTLDDTFEYPVTTSTGLYFVSRPDGSDRKLYEIRND